MLTWAIVKLAAGVLPRVGNGHKPIDTCKRLNDVPCTTYETEYTLYRELGGCL